jgi:hypothetical protein
MRCSRILCLSTADVLMPLGAKNFCTIKSLSNVTCQAMQSLAGFAGRLPGG